MNTSMMNRLVNTFDGMISFFSKHVFWLHLMILWAISVIFTMESNDRNWFIFIPFLGLTSTFYIPILIFAFFRKDLQKWLSKSFFYGLSLLVFVGYPVLLIRTALYEFANKAGIFGFHQAVRYNDEILFYSFLYIGLAFFLLEIILTICSNWKYEFKFIKRIKKLSLEQALLIILGFISGLLSLELSTNGQGINTFADVFPSLTKWLFVSIQFYIILFIYYLFYWINHYILINKVLKRKGVIPYILSFMFVVLIGYPIAAQIAWWITSFDYFGMPLIMNEGAFEDIFFVIPFIEMSVSIPFIVAIQWFQQGTEIATLEKEKSEAELTLLKQQINPHFFFNTLNNLYALSLKKDEATPEVILQLSELMRYVIYKGKEETVTLGEEVKYIEDYCELQRIRLFKKMDFRFTQNIENEHLRIPPLLFIILVENAFKHGVESSEGRCFLHIDLETTGSQLVLRCVNSFEAGGNTDKGIGLENLKQRLKLRFPRQHELIIKESEGVFEVKLTLKNLN